MGRSEKPSPLPTPHRIEVFVGSIASGETKSDAYRKMHPISRRWKNETVQNKASVWAQIGEVLARVEELRQKAAKDNEITVDRIINEVSKLAFYKPSDFFEWDAKTVTLIPKKDLSEEQLTAISEISETVTTAGGTIKIKLADKSRNLELLGRYLGIFKDSLNIKLPIPHKVTKPEEVQKELLGEAD